MLTVAESVALPALTSVCSKARRISSAMAAACARSTPRETGGELLAAHAREEGQATFDKNLVADSVPMAVVDRLEVVDVHVHQRAFTGPNFHRLIVECAQAWILRHVMRQNLKGFANGGCEE